MEVVSLPLSDIDSVQLKSTDMKFKILLISSSEEQAEQVSFYEMFAYLFFIFTSIEVVLLVMFFFVLLYLLRDVLIAVTQAIIVMLNYGLIQINCRCFFLMQIFKFFTNFVKKIDQNSENHSFEILEFKKFAEQKALAQEIQVLAENLDHFVWVVDFFSKKLIYGLINRRVKEESHEEGMLKRGILIFKKINSYEGLEIVYDKLIQQHKRNAADIANLKEAISNCQEILKIQMGLVQMNHHQDVLNKNDKQSLVEDDLQKLNNKICQYINNILNLVAKLLSLKLNDYEMEECKEIYDDVIHVAKQLNFKEFLKVRLLLKKARILYKRAAYSNNNSLFKRSAKKLDHAWKILDEFKQSDKDDNFQLKTITILKQKVLFNKGIASQYYGNDQEALKFFTSSLEYGNYYSNRQRVKTLNIMAMIFRSPSNRKRKEILQDLSAFIRKDKRNFYFLVDCSRQKVENKNKIATIIIKIFNDYLGDKDKITIIKFGEKIEPIIDLYEKIVIKRRGELETVDLIEQNSFLSKGVSNYAKNSWLKRKYYKRVEIMQMFFKEYIKVSQASNYFLSQYPLSGRCLYKAFEECIEQAKNKEEKMISKYIIMFAFGENNTRKEYNPERGHKTTIHQSSMNSGMEEENYSQGNIGDEFSQGSISAVSIKDTQTRLEGEEDFDNIQKELTNGFFHLLLIKQNIKNHGSQKSKIIQLCEKSKRHYIIDLDNKPQITDILKDVAGFLS